VSATGTDDISVSASAARGGGCVSASAARGVGSFAGLSVNAT
jgi:hypothetical protein